MSVYTLRKLLDDVWKKRGRLLNDVQTFPKGVDEYQEVWDCMNRYIDSCLRDKKGIQITNFCKIGFSQESTRAAKKWRPFFHLSEGFCRNYGIDNIKKGIPIPEKDQASFEEFNFSKAAIKFSNHLQKDNVFCGIRYIVQALGEAIAQGNRIEISFEAGKLCAEDRKSKFVFRSDFYDGIQVAQEVVKVDAHDYRPSRTFQSPTAEALKLRLEGSQVRSNNLKAVPEAQKGYESERQIIQPKGSVDNDESNLVIGDVPKHSKSNGEMDQIASHYSESDLRKHSGKAAESGGVDSNSDTDTMSQISDQSVYDPAKYKGPTEKQEKAHREAMDRYLTQMEIRASEAISDRREWEEHLDRCLKQERDDLERKKALATENSNFVLQQIEWNRVKKGHDRKNWVYGASAHEFPQFTEPDDAGLRKVMKDRQRQMRVDLDLQVRTNNALKTIERNKDRELEYSQIVANQNELITQGKKEDDAKRFEKQLLTDSWGREVRMKNIWKAIDNHTQAAQSATAKKQLLQMGDGRKGADFSDTSSTYSGFAPARGGSRTRPVGASTNLEQLKGRLKD